MDEVFRKILETGSEMLKDTLALCFTQDPDFALDIEQRTSLLNCAGFLLENVDFAMMLVS